MRTPQLPETDKQRRARAKGHVRETNAERKAYLAERAATRTEREAELEACRMAIARLADGKVKAHTDTSSRGVPLAQAVERAEECVHGGGEIVTPIVLGRMRRLNLCTSCRWALRQPGGRVVTESGVTITFTGELRQLWFEPCGCITENGAAVRPCTEQ